MEKPDWTQPTKYTQAYTKAAAHSAAPLHPIH